MYTQLRSTLPPAGAGAVTTPDGGAPDGRNVIYLGLTSLFTDISSEMISTVLPIYLLFVLRVGTLQLGMVDGLYQGTSALVRIWAGTIADRGGRHKEVAVAGYGISAICRLGLLLAGPGLAPVLGAVLADRAGKGIRTGPRDALISLSSTREGLAAAFGVHRALDTAGAMVGPVVAFSILALMPGRFDTVFAISFCFAGIGLTVLTVMVRNRSAASTRAAPAPSLRSTLRLVRRPRFAVLTAAAGALGLVTVSDAFVYLTLQHRLAFNPGFLPLLYVCTSLVYFLLAIPAGRLADRIGRGTVLVTGYVLLVMVYACLIAPGGGLPVLAGAVLFFGAFYACTDGIMAALASSALPPGERAGGLSLLGTAAAVAGLAASVIFGALWTVIGPQRAVMAFMAVLVVATAATAAGLARVGDREEADGAGATAA